MARWRLIAPHYLNVPGEEVVFTETNQDTGRQAKKIYPVPRWLHHEAPECFNYPGEVIVAQGTGIQHKDIIFVGPPTPDMVPLDDEAQRITDEHKAKWINPMENLPEGMPFAEALLSQFQKQLDKLTSIGGGSVSAPGVSQQQFEELQKQMAAMQAQNAELAAKLEAKPARRV